jgi:hypothetical protein
VVHNGLNTESGRHVKDDICIFGELLDEFMVADIAFDEGDLVKNLGNVLFRANDEGFCVCDLDTLAPGRIFSDLGDLFRTIVSPVSEDEADCSKVHVRPLFFRAVVSGWLSEKAPLLTPSEMDNIAFSGILIVFMQALRFCTDFLSGDVYYKVSHRLHNLDRARNQVALLTNMLDQQQTLDAIVKEELALAKHRKD